MAKLKQPFLSLAAAGAFAKHLVLRRRGRDTLIGETPHPTDPQTFAQKQWRTMYQKAVALWHLLSPAEKAAWERQATPLHMIGFAYFISQALKPNPGIYLPLAGGVMTGQINMDSNRITDLPAPGAAADPLRQADLTAHAALETGIHGLRGQLAFHAYKTAIQSIPPSTYTRIDWQAKFYDIGGYFDLTNDRFQPLIPGKYLILASIRLTSLHQGGYLYLFLYKNGTSHIYITLHQTAYLTSPMASGDAIVDMNGTTDYIDFYVWHNYFAARDLDNNTKTTWTAGFLIPQS